MNDLYELKEGGNYIVRVFVGDDQWDEIAGGLRTASEQAKCTITILPVEDIRNVAFIPTNLEKNP